MKSKKSFNYLVKNMHIRKKILQYQRCREHGLSAFDSVLVALRNTRTVTGSFDSGGKSIITNWRDARGLKDHEPKTAKWIQGKKGVFYDIGAHIGKFSFAAELAGMQVYAFEPHFENFRTICHNVILNKSKVAPFQIAVLGKTGVEAFPLSSYSSGSANHGNKERGMILMPVISFSLNDLRSILKLPPPTYLKIDVDGAEAQILEGSSLDSVKEILVEVGSDESKDRVHQILSTSFKLVDTDDLIGVRERGHEYPRNEFWARK
ncbi:MAG: hypothetical protein A2836_02250 [Candidatus Taylorbacteria bacterium RIFCSPHIGHO2_01_FULL_45_63]|nr:MAG: hypothetical protein A2836_02250 [Candidatus Taylorbacteria bacterium RIFCSPHIGHO2_01_FULL_45_63]OHA32511.1 MAG: hypothetical protein A3A22_00680 [Candidatus Taylorbacteria bacterium RIFCSPLOWO2_01_FULL_45_34b]